jgi:histone deacetylase 1/2
MQITKAIYGLKQSGYEWNSHLHRFLSSSGWNRLQSDHAIYCREKGGARALLAVYVDDIIIASSSEAGAKHIKDEIASKFDLKDNGECSEILGISIHQDRVAKTVTLDQSAQIKAFLDDVLVDEKRQCAIPMAPNTELPIRSKSPSASEVAKYRSILGTLQYYARISHPEISYHVNRLANFQTGPQIEHMEALMKICEYLRGVTNTKVILDCNDPEIRVFSDADLAGRTEDPRSTSGYCIFIGKALVEFGSKKQKATVRSTASAELSALGLAVSQLLTTIKLVSDLRGEAPMLPIKVFCDNSAVVSNVSNFRLANKERHVWIENQIVLECQRDGRSITSKIDTKENISDIFTKALPGQEFAKHRKSLGITAT